MTRRTVGGASPNRDSAPSQDWCIGWCVIIEHDLADAGFSKTKARTLIFCWKTRQKLGHSQTVHCHHNMMT